MLAEHIVEAENLQCPATFTGEFVECSGGLAASFLNPANAKQFWKQR